MWSAVNLLRNGPNISDLTRRHDRVLNFFILMESFHKTAGVQIWAVFRTP